MCKAFRQFVFVLWENWLLNALCPYVHYSYDTSSSWCPVEGKSTDTSNHLYLRGFRLLRREFFPTGIEKATSSQISMEAFFFIEWLSKKKEALNRLTGFSPIEVRIVLFYTNKDFYRIVTKKYNKNTLNCMKINTLLLL